MSESEKGGAGKITEGKSQSEILNISLVERIIKLEVAFSSAKSLFTASGITVLVIIGGIGWLLSKANTLNSQMEVLNFTVGMRKTEIEALDSRFKALAAQFKEIQDQLPDMAARAVTTAVGNPNGSFQRRVSELHPPHSVVAFNLNDCPPGWNPLPQLAGRVVVGAGAGNRDQNDKPLTRRMFGQAAGEESHKLTSAELPSDVRGGLVGDGQISSPDAQDFRGWSFKTITQTAGGGGQAHNTMPPFYTLQYCEK